MIDFPPVIQPRRGPAVLQMPHVESIRHGWNAITNRRPAIWSRMNSGRGWGC